MTGTLKRTLGIDEAGRGPVIGPMVIAAVVVDTKQARALTRAGLRDSKSYGASTKAKSMRAELAARVRAIASFVGVQVVDVSEIDRRVPKNELNLLEREVAHELIVRAPIVDRIVADGRRLFAGLQEKHHHLEALDRAEARHAAVASASVIAKHRRDQLYERICRRYHGQFGEIRGGGYGNAKTREFLRAYVKRHGRLPPEARRSWPYEYLSDIVGTGFDPFADVVREQTGQLALF